MKKTKEDKTNVIRILENAGVSFAEHQYDPALTDGLSIASVLEKDPAATCKTLVTVAQSKRFFVFVLPVIYELDLKACARLAGEKSIAMLMQKELFPLTGYIHGGCSPLGMKKTFPVFFEKSCADLPEITLSAGKVGRQITVSPADLIPLCHGKIGSFARPSGTAGKG